MFIVLLVEDDPDAAALVSRAFDKASLPSTLRSVRSCEEAISYLTGTGAYADRSACPFPSLILLDLKLPGRSGFEGIEWIRNHPEFKRIPVVVLTSSKQQEDIRRAYELGATSYMVKPVGFDELLDMVKAIGTYWLIFNRPPDLP